MRHHNANRKLGRTTDARRALLRSLARNLIIKESMTTTEARAKEVRPMVEKLITRARVGSVAAQRDIIATLGGDTAVARKLMKTLAPRYTERKGGYTRIIKAPARKGDASPMAVIEFV